MKLGILTLPLNSNYGGLLQAYALQEVLKRKGHETIQLNGKTKYKTLPKFKAPLAYTKRFVLKYLFRRNIDIFIEKTMYEQSKIVNKHTEIFIEKYINYSNVPLNQLPENFVDALVVGSDQIWRPSYTDYIQDSFLEFAKKWSVKRVSYAPSFGKSDWEFTAAETKKCGKLLQSFDGVSLREKSAIPLCKEKFGVDAKFVLDPTLLLEKIDYMKLIEDTPVVDDESMGDLMVYILDYDKDKKDTVEYLCNKFNYVSFRTGSEVENNEADIESRIQPPLEEWLKGFNEAKFIVTDSFHACVFSIIFKKPFIVYGNKFRGLDRFVSILSVLGLEDRLILNADQIKTTMPLEIDWNSVEGKLKLLQEESFTFLENYF
jgi:hypothetical protein